MAKEYRIDELVGSEELYHHGIKGQKWGVRRQRKKQEMKEMKEAYKRHDKFTNDFINGNVKGVKGNFGSNLDRMNATINANPQLKKDKELAEKYNIELGKRAAASVLATFGSVTVAMIMSDMKKKNG